MNDDQAALDAAERKAAALHDLGWETGAGATIWARAVSDELERHEAARERWSVEPNRETWERLHASALMIVIAIDQVLTFEERVRSLTGDGELERARRRFDITGPDARQLRDLVVHLDEYVIGTGRRQTGKSQPPLAEPYVDTFIYWGNGGGTYLSVGDRQMNLRNAARAAVELAEVVERIRAKYLERAELDANAALKRRYGM